MTIRQAADRHPLAAAILCAGLQFGITILILKAGKEFVPPAVWGKVKLAAFASTVVLPLLLTQALGLWRAVGFDLDRLRPPPFFFACFLPVLMFASMGIRPDARPDAGGEVLMQLVNAFGEELLFRGAIFALLLRLPVWQAIVANGLLFGSMHLIHGTMDGDWPGHRVGPDERLRGHDVRGRALPHGQPVAAGAAAHGAEPGQHLFERGVRRRGGRQPARAARHQGRRTGAGSMGHAGRRAAISMAASTLNAAPA
jgi:membrane protease YdiL (CAAX protease family)